MVHSLVLFAAGLGTRFGGLKPLAPVGPAGTSLLEVSIAQAFEAGIEDVVLVVGAHTEGPIGARFAGAEGVRLARQDRLGPSRAKPWGTVAALLSAGLDTCVVANGDDLYGTAAIRAAVGWLSEGAAARQGGDRGVGGGAHVGDAAAGADAAMVAYRLGRTLSGSGGVSRAIASVGANGLLERLTEHREVRRSDRDRAILDDGDVALAPDALVSMNLWAFRPPAIAALRGAYAAFVAQHATDPTIECALPSAIDDLVRSGSISVDVLEAQSEWLGVTWPDDVARVRAALSRMPFRPGRIAHSPESGPPPGVPGEIDQVAAAFGVASPIVAIERLPGGHIHETWAITSKEGPRYVAQRINTSVFPDPDACEENLRRIDDLLGGDLVPRLLRTVDGRVQWTDNSARPWRVAEYAEGTTGGTTASTAEQAYEAARAFGRFVMALEQLPATPLRTTIARFHDLDWRMTQLSDAVRADPLRRASNSRREIDAIMITAPELTLPVGLAIRSVHNDAKVANVRFSTDTDRVAKIVDLDTTMPGSVLFDIGELIRTSVTSSSEDAPDPDIQLNRVEAVLQGYADTASSLFGAAERTGVDVAGPLMALENAARFLADHLMGDQYFAIDEDGQNLARARCQTTIASRLLASTREQR